MSKILCEQILELDNTIRFVGIANLEGKLIAHEYRKGLRSLLTEEESFALHEKVKKQQFLLTMLMF